MKLRDYQQAVLNKTRVSLRDSRSACIYLPTGGGKTAIVSQIIANAHARKNRCWFIVPRNELLMQASEHFEKWKIPHGMIKANMHESIAYGVHIVSKDTLIRRYDRIRKWPDICIFDEAHLYLDRQIEICEHMPESKIIGVTATPERLDGRGLSELYDTLILGPQPRELIEREYLTDIRYFRPPVDGLETLHRRGTEYVQSEVEELLEKRHIYGNAVEHYRKIADKKPALVYCRSIKSAEEAAHRFSSAGYRFENIDGKMSHKRRKGLIQALRDGEIHGLTSCDLITYGLDVPRVEVIIMLRPTLSRTLWSQMIGRGMRPYPGKTHTIVLDHVGNLEEFGHPLSEYEWKFDGHEKRSKGERPESVKLCTICFCYFPVGGKCPNCGSVDSYNPRPDLEEVSGELVEEVKPVPLRDRPAEEKASIQNAISDATTDYQNGIVDGAVGKLLAVAKDLGYRELWVYHKLVDKSHMVNMTLLHEIARQCKFKPGWVYYKRQELLRRVG